MKRKSTTWVYIDHGKYKLIQEADDLIVEPVKNPRHWDNEYKYKNLESWQISKSGVAPRLKALAKNPAVLERLKGLRDKREETDFNLYMRDFVQIMMELDKENQTLKDIDQTMQIVAGTTST
jgi:hypothetical protein